MKTKLFLFIPTVIGILCTNIVSAQWQLTTINDPGTCFAGSSSNIFAGTKQSNSGGVFLSTDGGNAWTGVNNGLTEKNVKSMAINGTNIFAGTDYGIFLSTNNGSSWVAMNNGLTNMDVMAMIISGSNVFAGTDGGVYLSTNNGSSWTAVNSGLTNTNVTAMTTSGSNIFAGTGGGVFLSTNNGSSWTAVNNGLTDTYINAIAISGSNIFAGTNNGGVFLSTNNGSSWTAVNNGLTHTRISSLAVSGSNIFAGLTNDNSGGVFLSANNGSSWTKVSNLFGTYTKGVISLGIVGSNIFAGTFLIGLQDGDVYKRPLSEMVSGVNETSLKNYQIDVFPNPTNGKFHITSDELRIIDVEIHNMFGEKVYSTTQQLNNSPIDLSSQTNGIYLLQVKTEKGFGTQKIIINK